MIKIKKIAFVVFLTGAAVCDVVANEVNSSCTMSKNETDEIVEAAHQRACCPFIGNTEAGKIVKAASIGDLRSVETILDDIARGDTIEKRLHSQLSVLDEAITIALTHKDTIVTLTLQNLKRVFEREGKGEVERFELLQKVSNLKEKLSVNRHKLEAQFQGKSLLLMSSAITILTAGATLYHWLSCSYLNR